MRSVLKAAHKKRLDEQILLTEEPEPDKLDNLHLNTSEE